MADLKITRPIDGGRTRTIPGVKSVVIEDGEIKMKILVGSDLRLAAQKAFIQFGEEKL